MRRAYQAASLLFLALAIFVMAEARKLQYYTPLGPGPGFFPFWLGVLLAGLSVAWLAQITLRPVEVLKQGFVPDLGGVARILSIAAALLLFGFLVDVVGFQITMLAFLLFLLTALGRQKVIVTAAISLAGSFGLYRVFTEWLDVALPASSIEVLRNLGL